MTDPANRAPLTPEVLAAQEVCGDELAVIVFLLQNARWAYPAGDKKLMTQDTATVTQWFLQGIEISLIKGFWVKY